MEKYVVKVINLFSTFVEVEAENEEQARKLAKDLLKDSGEGLKHSYEGTVYPEEWPVAKASDLEKIADQEIQEDNKL